jgi:hypothetical protein
MGATRTENTALGRRALPLIKQVQRLIRHIELHPPAGVHVKGHGGKNHLSPHGLAGKHLWEYVDANELWTDKGMKWKDASAVTNYLYRTCVDRRSFGRMAAWDLIEAWLPTFRAYLRELQAVEIAADDEDSLGQEERKEAGRFREQRAIASLPAAVQEAEVVVIDHALMKGQPSGGGTWLEGFHPVVPGLSTGDPEIDAIAAIKNILDPLNDAQVKRVVSYIMNRRELQDA